MWRPIAELNAAEKKLLALLRHPRHEIDNDKDHHDDKVRLVLHHLSHSRVINSHQNIKATKPCCCSFLYVLLFDVQVGQPAVQLHARTLWNDVDVTAVQYSQKKLRIVLETCTEELGWQ